MPFNPDIADMFVVLTLIVTMISLSPLPPSGLWGRAASNRLTR